uniref:Prenyl transferase n=1 Tax=Kumanoa americana TaxID=1196377 RepID=A0A1C9CGG6_9FLOR|nr:prenyl transferase [Kumanoa americana]AOM67457.1 prenyl transferase [Kumanoa americana]
MVSKFIFSTISDDLHSLNQNLQSIVGARHPVLHAASNHLFAAGGKRIRPIIVLLISQATLNEYNIKPEHKRLAEITEIIHTASLVHDDIIDECLTRRGTKTVHNMFSTKVAVLAGDFLFAQSSWYLANLYNSEVVQTISKVITDFAEGEIRQGLISFDFSISINQYIEKSFYKTASLIAASCKGAAILSQVILKEQNDSYLYGKHLGLAFQIIDDILDLIGSTKSLGKPASSDLKNGNLTAPILFALTESQKLQDIISQEFENTEDIKYAILLVHKSKGLQKAKDLAEEHIQIAIESIKFTRKNSIYENLIYISQYILERLY